jgi:hypothetical protein
MSDESSQVFAAMFATLMNPEIVGSIDDARSVLAFDLPPSESKSFLMFHDFITNPQPRFITEWRSNPKTEKWYIGLVDGLNGGCRNAYSCVLYHQERVSKLEFEVTEKLSKRSFSRLVGNGTVGIGGTLVWDFEYQAYIFAYRRCLDYMTRGLAAFFKHNFHSFREFPEFLTKMKHKNVADALLEIHKRHAPNFAAVMSDGSQKSVRDRITHYGWVDAGAINLTKDGLRLYGGGEALRPVSGVAPLTLTGALTARTQMLKACIDDMLAAFVREARKWDAAQQTAAPNQAGSRR